MRTYGQCCAIAKAVNTPPPVAAMRPRQLLTATLTGSSDVDEARRRGLRAAGDPGEPA